MTAAALLEKPESWCQGANARNMAGTPVSSLDDDACKWCLVGAIIKTYPYALDRAKIHVKIKSIVFKDATSWNDDPKRTHAEVLALLKEVEV